MLRNQHKRYASLLSLLLALTLLLSACGGGSNSTPAPAPDNGGSEPAAAGSNGSGGITSAKDRLTFAISSDPVNLDPNDSTLLGHHHVTRQMYETLVVRDENMELVPCLAESWEYENDETLVFKLKKGVKFHNGEELKASDVYFTFQRVQESGLPGSLQINYVDLDRTEIRDDYTIAVVTKGPYPLQLPMLESSQIAIFSEKGYKDNNGDFNKVSYGTGPFQLEEYVSGESVLLKAFEDYRIPEQPYLKEVFFRVIQDNASRAIEVETGGVDVAFGVNATDVERLDADPNVNLIRAPIFQGTWLNFNTKAKPLDDIRVRQAIMHAINREAAVKVSYLGVGSVADGIFAPGLEGRHPDLTGMFPEYNVEKAKELLAEAGYPDGITISVITDNNDTMRMAFCEAIQAQLAQANITLELNFAESNAWSETLYAGKHQLGIYGLSGTTGEVGRCLLRFLPEANEYNIWGFDNPEFLDTIRKGLATIDDQTRWDLFIEAQQMIADNYILLPFWFKEQLVATGSDVKNLWVAPTYEYIYLGEVYFG